MGGRYWALDTRKAYSTQWGKYHARNTRAYGARLHRRGNLRSHRASGHYLSARHVRHDAKRALESATHQVRTRAVVAADRQQRLLGWSVGCRVRARLQLAAQSMELAQGSDLRHLGGDIQQLDLPAADQAV